MNNRNVQKSCLKIQSFFFFSLNSDLKWHFVHFYFRILCTNDFDITLL